MRIRQGSGTFAGLREVWIIIDREVRRAYQTSKSTLCNYFVVGHGKRGHLAFFRHDNVAAHLVRHVPVAEDPHSAQGIVAVVYRHVDEGEAPVRPGLGDIRCAVAEPVTSTGFSTM